MLNGRPRDLVVRNLFRPRNYLGVAKILGTFGQPITNLRRYFFGTGTYPADLVIRTPIGLQHVTLFGSHDSITATEIFCRGVYKTPSAPSVVVDLGSNIGLSALYFLTRAPMTTCYLFEPDPRNAAKLRQNLSGFERRYVFREVAVGEREGTTTFFRESTGRYGTTDNSVWFVSQGNEDHSDEISTKHGVDEMQVQVVAVNAALEEVLAVHDSIDLLKIDTEGTELTILNAIRPELLTRVRWIAIEWFGGAIAVQGFSSKVVGDMVRFTNRSM